MSIHLHECGEIKRPGILDRFRYKVRNLWILVKFWIYCAYWRILHFFRVGRLYSKFLCSYGWYPRFQDGRCMWCGKIHN